MEEKKERISFKALLIRYSYLYFLFYGLSWAIQFSQQIMDQSTGVLQMTAIFVFMGLMFAQGIFVLNLVLSFVRKKSVLFYEKASHTYTISTIKNK